MQFYDVIKTRTSIKSFKDTPIQKDKLARMIDAAMRSPSWKNHASFKFIIVDDPKEKEILASSIMNDTNKASISIHQAPVVAIVVAEPNLSGTIDDKEYYLVDGAIAMEHFVLAATNEGYGTCWIAALDEQKIKSTLSIPNGYRVIAMTPIGEIAQNEDHEGKKDVRDYVFLNEFGNAYTESHQPLGIH